MSRYYMVAASAESTVVAEYTPEPANAESYQSEAELERDFIRLLTAQGYEYLDIHNETSLIENLRTQLESLNGFRFTDSEWERFFRMELCKQNEGIVEKTRRIQTDPIFSFRRDDGSTKNIALLNKKTIHSNRLQVIHQYEEAGGSYAARYDVTILVNGLPLVHVELKRRGVAIQNAFDQIDSYQLHSFWAGSGLFEYVQIFVISNGTHTKYYSNTTRESHFQERSAGSRNRSRKTGSSFEFTSFWADEKNRTIPDLIDFTKTFFAKHTLLNLLTRYCVFTCENMLLAMRPYQIAATERILNRIQISTNLKQTGSIDAGGYIWHTTGSGKTLTSFKTAQLASRLPDIEKVLFVVDRKDLDYQTMKEYDRFQKGAANSNQSTAVLQQQLEDTKARIIITTIQKLDNFITKNKEHPVFSKHCVIIFDECHRSQFGDMHAKIVKAFKRYHLFGFTGTPIFAKNASKGRHLDLMTTPQTFGAQIHSYTIVDAINDRNVLPFRIDYLDTVKQKDGAADKEVSGIDTERALNAPGRIREIVGYILEHFDHKTGRTRQAYRFSALTNTKEVASAKVRGSVEEKKQSVYLRGFNSILAVASVEMAKRYYLEFQRQMEADPAKRKRIATIFSFAPHENESEWLLDEENSEDTSQLDQSSRDFLEKAIHDYNNTFQTDYNTSADKFQNYYKDVSLRMKNREIDLLIVVNMFLTGFDATTLNTLWVDKNLKMHGLIQAFSRTNRILNKVKSYGNIVCFRNLQKETDEAIALFGDKEAGSLVVLKSYEAYYNGYDEGGKHYAGYTELVQELKERFPTGQRITGEQNKRDFIRLFGSILRTRNILVSFDRFAGQDCLSEREMQNYQGEYLDLYQEEKRRTNEKENINGDLVFEIELIRQVEINIDYILMLVEKYHNGNCKDKEILATIGRAVHASLQLRSKKELIEGFIRTVNPSTVVAQDWQEFVQEHKERDLSSLIEEENLKPEEARRFLNNAFRDGALKTTGTDIDQIMPPVSRFGGSGRPARKQGLIAKLLKFFEKYFGLV